jgi:hypothetical protein
MENSSAKKDEGDTIQSLIAEYEFARDNRNHSDAVAWEMTAIVWGAQTLLLGFALEAISQRPAQPLVMLAGILGIVMCRFNAVVVLQTRNEVCKVMIQLCIEIEDRIPMLFKPQHRLTASYPSGLQSFWFKILNWSFVPVWVAVIARAGWLYCHHVSGSAS